jgi:hypothetical protein
MYLVQDISRTLVLKVLRALYAPYDHDLGPPCRFVVSPSVHKKLITFEQWRTIHMGEMLGEIMLDSYRCFEWYLGCPMIGQVPFPFIITSRALLNPQGCKGAWPLDLDLA